MYYLFFKMLMVLFILLVDLVDNMSMCLKVFLFDNIYNLENI